VRKHRGESPRRTTRKRSLALFSGVFEGLCREKMRFSRGFLAPRSGRERCSEGWGRLYDRAERGRDEPVVLVEHRRMAAVGGFGDLDRGVPVAGAGVAQRYGSHQFTTVLELDQRPTGPAALQHRSAAARQGAVAMWRQGRAAQAPASGTTPAPVVRCAGTPPSGCQPRERPVQPARSTSWATPGSGPELSPGATRPHAPVHPRAWSTRSCLTSFFLNSRFSILSTSANSFASTGKRMLSDSRCQRATRSNMPGSR